MSSMKTDYVTPSVEIEEKKIIKFRNDSPDILYACFSTFHDSPFISILTNDRGKIIDQREYRSVEQAYQFSRYFKNPTTQLEKEKTLEILNKIMDEESSTQIRKIGEEGNKRDYRSNSLLGTGQRPGWEDRILDSKTKEKSLIPFKYFILFQHLYQKFSQDTEALNVLKSTGKDEIIEVSKDEMLGSGKTGRGQNLHGRFLMLIRETL